MLSEIQKSRVRVHMGVPVVGLPATGSVLGWRYNQQVGQLEYRMNNLQPIEEAQLTGTPTGVAQITGNPQIGDTVTAVIMGVPVSYTVAASDLAAPIPLQSIEQNLGNAITLAGLGYLGNYGIPPQTKPGGGNYFFTGTLIITPTNGQPFTFAMQNVGQTVPYAVQQGVAIPPSITFAETGTTSNGYIAICDYLESRIALASDLVKYQKADVVNFRMNELAERENIYTSWRQRLADIMGVPLYPMGAPPRSGGWGVNTGAIV